MLIEFKAAPPHRLSELDIGDCFIYSMTDSDTVFMRVAHPETPTHALSFTVVCLRSGEISFVPVSSRVIPVTASLIVETPLLMESGNAE